MNSIMKAISIAFNKPCFTGREWQYAAEAQHSGVISGDGQFSRRCHEWFEQSLGVKKALLTTSCTAALEMCAILLDVQHGDEVILPSFTFVSSANAFVLRGARLVFVDIRPDTLNVDETKLEAAITSRTKAIVVVHYAGVGCEMDAISAIAGRAGVPIVEDNAHGLFGKYRGQWLGTFGVLATQSFHETKNVICGEGGALLINDPQYVERAEIIREKGTNRSRFFRGQVDKYSWVDIGSSFLMSDILAAVLYAQLEEHERIQSRRREIWETYQAGLSGWAKERGVQLPYIPPHCDQAWHMYYMIMPDSEMRDHLIQHLKSEGILSVFHYLPLHLSEMGRKFGGREGDCPVTERVSDCLLRLPFHVELSDKDVDLVVREVIAV